MQEVSGSSNYPEDLSGPEDFAPLQLENSTGPENSTGRENSTGPENSTR
jgi:hypothetical protein